MAKSFQWNYEYKQTRNVTISVYPTMIVLSFVSGYASVKIPVVLMRRQPSCKWWPKKNASLHGTNWRQSDRRRHWKPSVAMMPTLFWLTITYAATSNDKVGIITLGFQCTSMKIARFWWNMYILLKQLKRTGIKQKWSLSCRRYIQMHFQFKSQIFYFDKLWYHQ